MGEWMSAVNEAVVSVDWIAACLGDPGVRLVEIDVSRA
jgi:hypothetical protein